MFLKDTNNFTVTKANTLTTARTINGTSFNGSANITTANWGTARNLTIGNTAKSVNGSANVSWSLSEIGAAASSHTHSYLPLSGGTVTGNLTLSGALIPSGIANKNCGTTTNPWLSVISKNLYLYGADGVTYGSMRAYTEGTTSTIGENRTYIGNGLASGTEGNAKGSIVMYGSNKGYTWLQPSNNTASNITVYLPESGGTLLTGSTGVKQDTGTAINLKIGKYLYFADYDDSSVSTSTYVRDGIWNTNFSSIVASNFKGSLTGNASTATTLQTARTINGTSFNGSANITTANWGTARSITIGKTTKSVNGSGNVTWSLSEIGAADASNLLPLTGGTLSGKLLIAENDTNAGISASSPMQIGYGHVASYGNLKLYADTDATSGANGEYVHIATGSNQPSINSGLTVYRDYATCNNVQFTNGDIVLNNNKAIYGKATDGGSRIMLRMTGSNVVDVGNTSSVTCLLGPSNPTWWNGSTSIALAHSQTNLFEGSNYKFGQGLYGTSDVGVVSTTSAATVQGMTAWIKRNNYYAGDGDRFVNASTTATQLYLEGSTNKAQIRWSTNTPAVDGKITWSTPEKIVSSPYNVTIHGAAPSSPAWGDVWIQV